MPVFFNVRFSLFPYNYPFPSEGGHREEIISPVFTFLPNKVNVPYTLFYLCLSLIFNLSLILFLQPCV